MAMCRSVSSQACDEPRLPSLWWTLGQSPQVFFLSLQWKQLTSESRKVVERDLDQRRELEDTHIRRAFQWRVRFTRVNMNSENKSSYISLLVYHPIVLFGILVKFIDLLRCSCWVHGFGQPIEKQQENILWIYTSSLVWIRAHLRLFIWYASSQHKTRSFSFDRVCF